MFATVVALSLMNLFQKELDPLRAAIVYAIEPLWALFFGVWKGLDVLSGWLWIGGALLLAGNLVAVSGPSAGAQG